VVIRLLDAAREDLRRGWLFYERQGAGLGDRFLDVIAADVQALQLTAGIHLKVDGFHRLLSRRFPYAVYYLVEPETIDIYAILDCRRDPLWIQERLGGMGT
jgi:plasmid stabilization system protein ParE